MKNWKLIMVILVIFAIIFTFVSCDNGNGGGGKKDEQPEYREKGITLNFGSNEYNIKVSGTMLATEWNGVPEKVESVLEGAYPTNPQTMDDIDEQQNFQDIFGKTGANVIVEKTTAYTNYKIIGDGITLCLRFSALNSISSEFVTSEHLNHSTYGKNISIIYDAILRMFKEETHSN